MAIRWIVGTWVATSFSMRELDGSGARDCLNTGSEMVTSCRVGAEEVIGRSILVEAIVVSRPIGIETPKCAGKKLKQSS